MNSDGIVVGCVDCGDILFLYWYKLYIVFRWCLVLFGVRRYAGSLLLIRVGKKLEDSLKARNREYFSQGAILFKYGL